MQSDLTGLRSWCCQLRLFHTELFLGITRDSPLHVLPHTSWRNSLCSLFSVLTSPGFPGSCPGRECRCSHGCLSSPFPFSHGQRQQQRLFPAHHSPWSTRSRAVSCGPALWLSPGHSNTECHRHLGYQCQQSLPRGSTVPSAGWGGDGNTFPEQSLGCLGLGLERIKLIFFTKKIATFQLFDQNTTSNTLRF